jgi:hypothetical protein
LQIFDVESRCKLNCKFEGLSRVSSYVYVLPLVESNLEFKKHMHVDDLYFVSNPQKTLECLAKEVEIQEFSPIDDFDQLLPPLVGFRVGGESTDHVAFDLKSTLVSAEIMAT